MYILHLAKLKEKGIFLEGEGKNGARWDYAKQHLVFNEINFLLLWNLNNPTPTFDVL